MTKQPGRPAGAKTGGNLQSQINAAKVPLLKRIEELEQQLVAVKADAELTTANHSA